jgi:hypothetical protein
MNRRPWVSVGAAVTTAVLIGPGLIFEPEVYRGGAFQYTFLMLTPGAWGWLFESISVLYLGGIMSPSWPKRPHIQKWLTAVLAGLLGFLFIVWTGLVTAAKLDPGGAVFSWLGPGFWAFLTYAHLVSFARFGPGRE